MSKLISALAPDTLTLEEQLKYVVIKFNLIQDIHRDLGSRAAGGWLVKLATTFDDEYELKTCINTAEKYLTEKLK